MKALKVLLCVVLALALAASLTLSWMATLRQNRSGGYSAASPMTEQSKVWILENFGHYETLPDLLDGLTNFACKNFVYDKMTWFPNQHFIFDRFVFEKAFHGVCYDFSCFAKCVVLQWQAARDREDVQVFVYDVRLKDGSPHSYNIVHEDGAVWYICLTSDSTRAKKGKLPGGRDEVPNGDVEAYMAGYGDKLMNIH